MLKHLHMARLEGLTGEISFTDRRMDNLQIHLVMRGEEAGLGFVGVLGMERGEMELDDVFRDELDAGAETVNVYVTVSTNLQNLFLLLWFDFKLY